MLFNKLDTQASHIIKKYEKEYAALTNLELSQYSLQLKKRLNLEGQSTYEVLEEKAGGLLLEAFALVREVAFRELGYRHHKEQLMAGIALYKGYLTQMQTGEGKTLAITAPAYLAALSGHGVHVITANDYLAERDCENMSGIYTRLGISCAVITANQQFLFESSSIPKTNLTHLRPCTRQEAYRADITYGTASVFGFDYLRDHLARRKEELVRREEGLEFAILDEADNILLDEARTPLIISSQSNIDISHYYIAIQLIRRLTPGQDYEVNKAKHTVSLTEKGISKLEGWLNPGNSSAEEASLYSGKRSELFYLDNCLKALTLYNRDEDYLVNTNEGQSTANYTSSYATYPLSSHNHRNPRKSVEKRQKGCAGEVVLIDRVTGRPMPGRRLGGGLHEALEAKEGLVIKRSTLTVANISLHAYFKQYRKLAGLSGTLETAKDVLYRLYGLETIVIPTHRPIQRLEARSLVFLSRQVALNAIVKTAIRVRESGAPVLIGTPSVTLSEELSNYLAAQNVPHQVLNARQTEQEARIIARAGYPARITIATNMAGRGTDILLGGRYEGHLSDLAKERGLVREADEGTLAWRSLEVDAHNRCNRAKEIVYRAGGLHVLGLGLQSSRRLDRQLIGRAGRQGDPGYSQFFYSFEDELVVHYAGESGAYHRLVSLALEKDEAQIEELNFPLAHKLVEECQYKSEGQQLDVLIQAIEFDTVLNRQRELFYRDRQTFLQASADELKAKILELAFDNSEKTTQPHPSQSNRMYLAVKARLDQRPLIDIVRESILSALDQAWTQYLTPLEELRQGISLRAYGGQKPIQAYQLEARRLWDDFQREIRQTIIKVVLGEVLAT